MTIKPITEAADPFERAMVAFLKTHGKTRTVLIIGQSRMNDSEPPKGMFSARGLGDGLALLDAAASLLRDAAVLNGDAGSATAFETVRLSVETQALNWLNNLAPVGRT